MNFFLTMVTSLILYLPPAWNAQHAQDDIAKAHTVVVCRCIGIRMIETQQHFIKKDGASLDSTIRSYVADLRIGKTLIGEDISASIVPLYIGYDEGEGAGDMLDPAHENLTLCNSQHGYDLRANQVYVLFFEHTASGFDLRSGPFSIGWVQPGNIIRFGARGGQWQEPVPYVEYLQKVKR